MADQFHLGKGLVDGHRFAGVLLVPRDVGVGACEPAEQRGEQGELVRLRANLDLPQGQGVVVGGCSEQVHRVALGVEAAPHGLTVHHDRDQFACVGVRLACRGVVCGDLGG